MNVLSIGEILWDVFPDQELLGGAALNFSVNAGRLGDSTTLITAVGDDQRGRAALAEMKSFGLSTDFVQRANDLPTGVATVGTSASGEPQFAIPRPAAFDRVRLTPQILEAAARLNPDWLYFGTLLQTELQVEAATRTLLETLPGIRGFYDMNLREGHWNLPLVDRLCRLASVLKLNEVEAQTLSRLTGAHAFSLPAFCELWTAQYKLDAICVTLGPDGCFVYRNGSTESVPAFPTSVRDTVGAGDAFAAAFLHGYHRGWPMVKTARFANALGSIVASRAGATPSWSIEEWGRVASQNPD
ncbi:MAG TPA: PfkB family carbohydrate kinase [Silvibacterium sp.]|nr:PfkB family carbohydrate kinase [Silvibacterium sp.]